MSKYYIWNLIWFSFFLFKVPSSENVDRLVVIIYCHWIIDLCVSSSRTFSKFKEAIRLLPANIQRETPLDGNSARDVFPAIQPIYRYVKVWYISNSSPFLSAQCTLFLIWCIYISHHLWFADVNVRFPLLNDLYVRGK